MFLHMEPPEAVLDGFNAGTSCGGKAAARWDASNASIHACNGTCFWGVPACRSFTMDDLVSWQHKILVMHAAALSRLDHHHHKNSVCVVVVENKSVSSLPGSGSAIDAADVVIRLENEGACGLDETIHGSKTTLRVRANRVGPPGLHSVGASEGLQIVHCPPPSRARPVPDCWKSAVADHTVHISPRAARQVFNRSALSSHEWAFALGNRLCGSTQLIQVPSVPSTCGDVIDSKG